MLAMTILFYFWVLYGAIGQSTRTTRSSLCGTDTKLKLLNFESLISIRKIVNYVNVSEVLFLLRLRLVVCPLSNCPSLISSFLCPFRCVTFPHATCECMYDQDPRYGTNPRWSLASHVTCKKMITACNPCALAHTRPPVQGTSMFKPSGSSQSLHIFV